MTAPMTALAGRRTQVWPGLRRAGAMPGLALLAGAALGLVVAVGWWGEALLEVWSLHQAVEQMQAEHQRAAATAAAPGQPLTQTAATAGDGPALSERDAAWLWLQQRLQAHGLRVEALKPEALQTEAVLASQLAHVRLQGAWADWMAFGQQAAVHAPWWQWVQWQVLPSGVVGQVQIEGRLRLWLQPERLPSAPARVWPVWPVSMAREPVRLFATGDDAALEPVVQAQAAAPVPGPAWRLWGVWRQADHTRVVLGRGTDWTTLAPGQVLGAEGYRLDHVGAEGVHLKGPRSGHVLHLPWEAKP